MDNNQVVVGKLKCNCGQKYDIEDGILKAGKVCGYSNGGNDNNFITEYINSTDAAYLDTFHKSFQWTCKKISSCKLNNKVLLELGTGMGFFLRNIYNELPENCVYIAVDHNIERQRFLKGIFERIEHKRNIIFVCCDFLEIPIKQKSVDVVFDITGTSNYSFNFNGENRTSQGYCGKIYYNFMSNKCSKFSFGGKVGRCNRPKENNFGFSGARSCCINLLRHYGTFSYDGIYNYVIFRIILFICLCL